jgi:hypothetical protein
MICLKRKWLYDNSRDLIVLNQSKEWLVLWLVIDFIFGGLRWEEWIMVDARFSLFEKCCVCVYFSFNQMHSYSILIIHKCF